MPACICWSNRKERNDRCFEGKIVSVQQVEHKWLWLFVFQCNLQEVNYEDSTLELRLR